MDQLYINILLILLIILVCLFYKINRPTEGFNVTTCKTDKDCPRRFACSSGSCKDMRPKGN